MTTKILLGDEAVALGAVHAGLAVGYSYPGTPASEVMEYLIRISKQEIGFRAKWCVNEKVAYEEALGVSFAGKRTMVSMKHVGLNVAADPFMNSALITIMGGLVVVVADDPGMHSSQNEQDSRYYSQFAHIMCFEPSDHQEAYDPRKESKRERGKDRDWTLLPVNARRGFKALVEKQKEFVKVSEESRFNSLILNKKNNSLGIIASGIGYNYVKENIEDKAAAPSILKISTYPLPQAQLSQLVEHVDTILIIEEGYPFIERQLRGLFGIKGKSIQGKLSGHLPPTGELQPDIVRKAMQIEPLSRQQNPEIKLAGRPPQLCKGCSHADTVIALNQVLESYPEAAVFSDIGCYTLAALPPYNAVDTCVCMGASVSMAKGGAEAGVFPSVGMIGDSTFAHSGITPLVDAAAADTNMTLIIADNASVAMTGGQPSFLSGDKLLRMIEGAGVDKKHIRVLIPLPKNLEKCARERKKELSDEARYYPGWSRGAGNFIDSLCP